MTQEQKAKAYDKALERAKQVRKYSSDLAEIKRMEEIFPELKSEDERIRKNIKVALMSVEEELADFYSTHHTSQEEFLAWLEKQGTYYTKRDVDDAYVEGMAFAKNKLEKQKSEWSEEDEANFQGIIDEIEANKNQAPDYDVATYDKFLSWLKSLKDRVQPQSHWKPSEEQMKALHDMNLTGNISYAGQGQVLIELYNDLEKL